jgi:hypothetical protein
MKPGNDLHVAGLRLFAALCLCSAVPRRQTPPLLAALAIGSRVAIGQAETFKP